MALSTPCNGFINHSVFTTLYLLAIFQLHVMDSPPGVYYVRCGANTLSTPCNGFSVNLTDKGVFAFFN
jgi:hypothetical protein